MWSKAKYFRTSIFRLHLVFFVCSILVFESCFDLSPQKPVDPESWHVGGKFETSLFHLNPIKEWPWHPNGLAQGHVLASFRCSHLARAKAFLGCTLCLVEAWPRCERPSLCPQSSLLSLFLVPSNFVDVELVVPLLSLY